MSTVQELKESLVEAEENYVRVVELNTHLKKDKAVLMYQLDALREELDKLEEELWETKRSSEGQIKLQCEEIQRLSDELKETQDTRQDLRLDKETAHVMVDSSTEPAETPDNKEGRTCTVSTGARAKKTGRTSGRSRTFRRSQSTRLVIGSNRNQHVVVPARKKSLPSFVCGRTEVQLQSHITASPAPKSRLRPPRPACDIILDAAGKLLVTPLNERFNMGCFLMSHLTQNAKSVEAESYQGLIDEPIPEPEIESGSSPEPEAHLGLEPEPDPSGGPRPVLGLVQKNYIRATWDFEDSWRSRLIFHEFHFAEPAQPRHQGARHKETKLKQSKRRRNTTSSIKVKKLFEKTAEEILAMTISDIEDGKVPASTRLPKQQRQASWKHKSNRLDSQVTEISEIALRSLELGEFGCDEEANLTQEKQEAQKTGATIQEASKEVLQVILEVGQEAQEVDGQAAEKTVMSVVQEEGLKRRRKDKKKQHPKCKVS